MENILHTLGLNTNDPSISDTPKRVAKMYVNELFAGLKANEFPPCTTFNVGDSNVVIHKDIPFISMCEHHL